MLYCECMLISNLLVVMGLIYVVLFFYAAFISKILGYASDFFSFAIFTFTYTFIYRYVLLKKRKKPKYRPLIRLLHVLSLFVLLLIFLLIIVYLLELFHIFYFFVDASPEYIKLPPNFKIPPN